MRPRSLILALAFCAVLTGCAEQRLLATYYADKVFHPGNPTVLVPYFDAQGNITRWERKRLCDVTDCETKHRPARQRKVAPK